MMERHLIYTQQAIRSAKTFERRYATIKPEKLAVALSTLRIEGFELSGRIVYMPRDSMWHGKMLCWQRNEGKGTWGFDIVLYNQWRKHVKLQASNAERVRPTR